MALQRATCLALQTPTRNNLACCLLFLEAKFIKAHAIRVSRISSEQREASLVGLGLNDVNSEGAFNVIPWKRYLLEVARSLPLPILASLTSYSNSTPFPPGKVIKAADGPHLCALAPC